MDREELLRKWDEWCRVRNLTEDTRKIYLWVAEDFLKHVSNIPPSKDDVIAYVNGKTNKPFYWTIVNRFLKINGINPFTEAEEELYRPRTDEKRVSRPYIDDPSFVETMVNATGAEWLALAILISAETGLRRKQLTFSNPKRN